MFGARKIAANLPGLAEVFIPDFKWPDDLTVSELKMAHDAALEAMVQSATPWSVLLNDDAYAKLETFASQFS